VKVTLFALGCLLAMGTAPLAHADDQDTAYLAAIQSVGIPANSPAATPAYGRQLCDRISEAGFDPLVGVVNHENESAGFTMHQSALVIGAAVSNYCLNKVDQLPKELKY
jgi:Protein of unknown function (DUF732)